MLHVQVDCSEMPEDMDSAQNFMEENLNLYDGVATEPGGEALVVIIHTPCYAASSHSIM